MVSYRAQIWTELDGTGVFLQSQCLYVQRWSLWRLFTACQQYLPSSNHLSRILLRHCAVNVGRARRCGRTGGCACN
jgi:hypothetical protein